MVSVPLLPHLPLLPYLLLSRESALRFVQKTPLFPCLCLQALSSNAFRRAFSYDYPEPHPLQSRVPQYCKHHSEQVVIQVFLTLHWHWSL